MKFDNRTTELIAVGASIAANCQSCVEYHVAKAAEYGVGPEAVSQAVEVGRMVRRGAAAKVDNVAEHLLHTERASAAAAATAGCGCGS
jgi:AhpD family alkylhydroperoxidase